MLKRADTGDLSAIRRICDGSIIGCKILCQVLSYGFERNFLEVWLMCENDTVLAVITKFYDDAAVITSDDESVDCEQLKLFFSMSGYNTIILSEELALRLGFESAVIKKGYRFECEVNGYTSDLLNEDDYYDAYELISREIPGSFKKGRDAYLSFVSDFTFRQRRSMARGVCTHDGDKLASVAVTSSETKNAAVISGVACDSSLRKKGIGKTTVLSIVERLLADKKTPYVIALNESAEGFYEHIGFIQREKIAFCEREKNV